MFSLNIYQPTHLKNVFEGLVLGGFKSRKIQGECLLKINFVNIALISLFYEFSYKVFSHVKFLMRQC